MTCKSLLCLALGVAAAGTGCQGSGDEAPGPRPTATGSHGSLQLPAHLERHVDTYISSWGRQWPAFRFHGEIAISVGGDLQLRRAYGYRDLAAQREHEGGASFRIGTLSAHITALATVALGQRGRLELDDRVDEHVGEKPVPDALTIEHLLTYTSGLPSFTQDLAFEHLKHLPRTHEEIVDGFVGDPLEFEPGTDFAPSNSNAALLGLVVERATGRSYADAVRTHVLDPLGMSHTHWGRGEGEAVVGLVFDEREHLEPPRGVDPRAFGAAGGWTSTSEDLHRLYAALWTDRFGGEQTRRRWFGDNALGRPFAFVEAGLPGGRAYLWLGLIDGFNSAVLLVPDDELVVTVLGNNEAVPAQDLVLDVARLVYDLDVDERVEPREVPVDPGDLQRVAGPWVVTSSTENMLLDAVSPETFDMLKGVRTEHDVDAGTLTLVVPEHGRKRMHPLGGGRFFFKDGPQSTAYFRLGATPARDTLFLQRDGTELRYRRVPQHLASRAD